MRNSWLLVARFGLLLIVAGMASEASAVENNARTAASQSILADEVRQFVAALADDTFEGREAGSRGGRAAGLYVVKQLTTYGLQGGAKATFYQRFGAGCCNILGFLEGSDPELKKQVIVASAHRDHVGYGSSRTSYGPIGHIHNGADDNASGVAGLLAVVGAFSRLGERPRRSILFAFWDGEEKGLLGSKHWIDQPTLPLQQVSMMVNADMIGRLRNARVEVFGSRSSRGLRRLLSQQNEANALWLDFNWEMKANSDHYTFFKRQIPVVMVHTGLHNDYHRPSDDAEKINADGVQHVARLMFNLLVGLADEPSLAGFRKTGAQESPGTQVNLERPLPPLPGRLGVTWDDRAPEAGGLTITKVVSGSAAARAGLRAGDRIVQFAEHEPRSAAEFRSLVLTAHNPVPAVVQRPGEKEPLQVTLELLGSPTRLGISSRMDDAEPGVVALNRVVPGSPADLAGLKLNDRIYRVGGRDFADGEAFRRLVTETPGPLELTVETRGRVRTVSVELPKDK